jgi:cell division transport system ATP-binding protein
MRIKFDKVSKNFGDVVALNEVSFEVKPKEFLFITGPSGSGKTTVFRLISAHFMPSTGLVELGEDIVFDEKTKPKKNQVLEIRRRIGTIYQDFQLLTECTVKENIEVALDIAGIPKELRQKQLEKVIEKVGLVDRLNMFPAQLSGGELQRLSLARALSISPELVLADEPTGNLDPQSSWQLIELLSKINKEGTTVIMATHDFDIVDSLGKRVIKLEKGKKVSDKDKAKYEEKEERTKKEKPNVKKVKKEKKKKKK